MPRARVPKRCQNPPHVFRKGFTGQHPPARVRNTCPGHVVRVPFPNPRHVVRIENRNPPHVVRIAFQNPPHVVRMGWKPDKRLITSASATRKSLILRWRTRNRRKRGPSPKTLISQSERTPPSTPSLPSRCTAQYSVSPGPRPRGETPLRTRSDAPLCKSARRDSQGVHSARRRRPRRHPKRAPPRGERGLSSGRRRAPGRRMSLTRERSRTRGPRAHRTTPESAAPTGRRQRANGEPNQPGPKTAGTGTAKRNPHRSRFHRPGGESKLPRGPGPDDAKSGSPTFRYRVPRPGRGRHPGRPSAGAAARRKPRTRCHGPASESR